MVFTALLLRENHDFPSNGFQNKTSFLFETSQPRISLFECWDESSSDHQRHLDEFLESAKRGGPLRKLKKIAVTQHQCQQHQQYKQLLRLQHQ